MVLNIRSTTQKSWLKNDTLDSAVHYTHKQERDQTWQGSFELNQKEISWLDINFIGLTRFANGKVNRYMEKDFNTTLSPEFQPRASFDKDKGLYPLGKVRI